MRMLEMHIEVADLEQAIQFYQRLIPEARISRWQDGLAAALILPDGSAFGLWKKGRRGLLDGRGGDHLHFAFQIEPEDYDTYKARLLELGLEVIEHVWDNGHRSLYFFDPDGHQGEFMTCDWIALTKRSSASESEDEKNRP